MTAYKTIVMEDSPEAATYRMDIEGWVSRDGKFCGDGKAGEHAARYVGSTHRKCETCGAVIAKTSYCQSCHDKRIAEKYKSAERVKWDGVTPLVIAGSDRYFWTTDDLDDYCDEHFCKPSDLMLMVCDPQYARGISSDIWEDVMPEDMDVPDELEDAIKEFNKAVKAYGKPLSWTEGKFAVEGV